MKVQSLVKGWHGYEDWETFAVRSDSNLCLAVVGDVDRATADQNKANAHLFAASPDLLKACKRMVKFACSTKSLYSTATIQGIIEEMNQAITKATHTP